MDLSATAARPSKPEAPDVLHRTVVDLHVDETMRIGGALVTLKRKSGRLARLVVLAPNGIDIKPRAVAQG